MEKRDWKKELETVGGAIGKAYKTREGKKVICVGDARIGCSLYSGIFSLFFREDGMPIYNSTWYGLCVPGKQTPEDIVGPWIEPKPKVKRAQAIVRRKDERSYGPYVPARLFKDIDNIREAYGEEVFDIICFPFGPWVEYDE